MIQLSKNLENMERLVKIGQYSFFDIFGKGKYHDLNNGNSYDTLKFNKEKYNLVDMWPDNYIYNFRGYDSTNIHEIIDKIKAKKVPNIIHIEDIPNNNEIIKELEKNGFKMIVRYPAMYLHTNNVQIGEIDDSIEIRLVDCDELVLEWAKVKNTVWGTGDKDKDMLSIDTEYKVYKELYKYRDKIRLYVGFYDGNPVATSLCTLESNVIGLYMITTNPNYRHKGIGRLMTRWAMLDARAEGYEHGVLHATDEGKKMYEKIGFEEVFCSNTYWLKLD